VLGDVTVKSNYAQDSFSSSGRKTLADTDNHMTESRAFLLSNGSPEKVCEKRVRFGGAVVVDTKYISKDLEGMDTVYKLYDHQGRHVGSKWDYQRVMDLYKDKPKGEDYAERSMLHKRKFDEMIR
jgi:hypothetical protein